MIHQDTICAISTAPGTGGVAVIRISGPCAISICSTLFVPKRKGVCLADLPGYSLCYGTLIRGGEAVDDVMLALFRNPHSFTGEDTVEITCHGSVYIQQQIVLLLIESGCRSALPGEFTQRAFLNGKMDLSQAEAVADLIASSSAGQHRLAMNQMRGGFSAELMQLRARLLEFTSLIELELDFSEEEVEFADRANLRHLALEMEQQIARLANSFSVGNAVKQGIPVAIIGQTNAGKSTLLNLLVGEERAIVSDIHGTTRDVIEDVITLGGISFRFIDTAGIRDTADTIENLGIKRSYHVMEQAAIILWMIDLTSSTEQIEALARILVPKAEGKQLLLVFNKADLLSPQALAAKQHLLSTLPAERLYISAREGQNVAPLQQYLLRAAALPELSSSDVIVTNIRHYEALTHALEAVRRLLSGLDTHLPGDLLSQDSRECAHYLSEITGQISTDEVLGEIFGRFCIGK